MAEHHSDEDLHWMQQALLLARRAEEEHGEVPVGALLVLDGTVVGEGHNHNIGLNDPSAHAEIQALRDAGRRLGNYRFPGATLYVTLEPCAMCAMALIHARITRVVYAATDPKTGAAGSVFDTLISERHNHRIVVEGGVAADQSSELLRAFFRRRR
ncbi:MAG: tRNA adenosine(34) deaminase TadA [Rhodanobacteraceae bacterium]|nr:tRNA adenosine(34) deaminase TadA [Rhodanobacteraceae bacterium]